MATGRAFLKDNAFVVAAVALPVVVAAFFVLASAVPQWTVPAPTYDLVLRVARGYDAPPAKVILEFNVRNGRVEAIVRPAPPDGYVQQWALLLFNHETMRVDEVPLDLPASMAAGEAPLTVAIEALADRRVSSQTVAPDGYELQTRTNGNSGLVGDLFGMGRYRQRAALVNGGRVVALDLPAPFQDPYQSPAYAVGWVLGEWAR
jgi:hypothetical protein